MAPSLLGLTLFALVAPAQVRAQYHPGNRAACALDWFDALAHTMHAAEQIIALTTDCAVSTASKTAKSRATCTKGVFDILERTAELTQVGQGMAFDCFGKPLPCSQMIVGAFKAVTDAASALTGPVVDCTPEKGGKVSARQGFKCYKDVWTALKKVMQMATNIDQATKTCVPGAKVPSLGAAAAAASTGAAE